MIMLFHARPIAVSAAVVCFFALSVVGALGGLTPYTCCKRAVLGAAVACLTVAVAVRAVNAVLTQALIAAQSQRKGDSGDGRS